MSFHCKPKWNLFENRCLGYFDNTKKYLPLSILIFSTNNLNNIYTYLVLILLSVSFIDIYFLKKSKLHHANIEIWFDQNEKLKTTIRTFQIIHKSSKILKFHKKSLYFTKFLIFLSNGSLIANSGWMPNKPIVHLISL